jgi:hypothetical protein
MRITGRTLTALLVVALGCLAHPAEGIAGAGTLAHFHCYALPQRTVDLPTLSLDDVVYGPLRAELRSRRRLCNPADKNGEDPSAPESADHLIGYAVRRERGFPRFHHHGTLMVENQLGETVVEIRRPELLLVPSAKSDSAPVPPPAAAGVDHYKCYRVRGARQRSTLSVRDQFGTFSVSLRRPVRLCIATDKNGEGVLDPAAHLMCYEAKAAPGIDGTDVVWFANQLEASVTAVKRATEICVPSTVP